MARRSKDWQDRRHKRKPDDTEALARIHAVIGDLPTYGHRRVSAVEWLTDNGSAYRSYQTRQFARMVGLEPKHTAVRSPTG